MRSSRETAVKFEKIITIYSQYIRKVEIHFLSVWLTFIGIIYSCILPLFDQSFIGTFDV